MSERIDFLKWVLVDQIQDLTIATKSIRDHVEVIDSQDIRNETVWYLRMCTMFLFSSLAKLWEVLDHYNNEIRNFPEPLYTDLKKLKAEIESKKIYAYRSKYGAHLIDRDTKKPISIEDGKKLYKQIVGNTIQDLLNFCEWVIPESYPDGSYSVMNCVVRTRDHCVTIVGSGVRP